MKVILAIFAYLFNEVISQGNWQFVGNPLIHAYPCKNVKDVIISYEPGLPEEKKNVYSVLIERNLPAFTEIDLKTDIQAVVKLADKSKGRVTLVGPDTFNIRTFNETDSIAFAVHGPNTGLLPYFDSLKINAEELCTNPKKGFLKKFVNSSDGRELPQELGFCGRRKVLHTELIVEGTAAKSGDWPWHVAIYRFSRSVVKYICGGTLLSKNYVLTAAHCASIRGEAVIPDILNVVLGKHYLVGGDVAVQEKEVYRVILHEHYNHQAGLDNDIALLKLKTEVTYTDYVQPTCLWTEKIHEKSPTKEIYGMIVGWGFDQNNELATELQQAKIPIVPETVCYKSNPLFYAKVLNDNKFCAGWKNGTSACNGDSGGGLFVFIPDVANDAAENARGAWYLKGLVSLTVSKREQRVCDPTQYVVFTDVSKYRDWIETYVEQTPT